MRGFGTALDDLETMRERIARIDEDRVVAMHARPSGDAGADALYIADGGVAFDAAVEQAADYAFVDEVIADTQLSLGCELRHAGRGSGAARRAVDRLVAIEYCVAAMRALVARRAGPLDVADTADRQILRMLGVCRGVDERADDWAVVLDLGGGKALQSAEILLRVDDGVEIDAIGDIDRELAETRHINEDPRRPEGG